MSLAPIPMPGMSARFASHSLLVFRLLYDFFYFVSGLAGLVPACSSACVPALNVCAWQRIILDCDELAPPAALAAVRNGMVFASCCSRALQGLVSACLVA